MRALDKMSSSGAAIVHLEEHSGEFLSWLVEVCRIPSVSAEGFPPDELRRSAEAIASSLRRAGLDGVRVIELPDVHPYVYGEWLGAPNAPTLLFYGHRDVQPAGRPEHWVSPPFEPLERDGRLYGRGTVDDKGGVLAILAGISCTLRSGGTLPCNVKVLIDGEEEIGSPHLSGFLDQYRELIVADAVAVFDTPNVGVGRPAITYRLRGMCQIDLEVRCLRRPLHSGRGGGAVPDPIQVLCTLIAALQAEGGRLRVPGLYRRVTPPSAAERNRLLAVPFAEAQFKEDTGVAEGVELTGEREFSVLERVWTRPSLTVTAIDAPSLRGSSNQIVDRVASRLSLRTVPKMDWAEAGDAIVRRLERLGGKNAHVRARVVRGVPWWTIDPVGPAFEAARRAVTDGYGVEPILIGSGGSIGFVDAFSRSLPGVPALLLGLEDPACNAHSENESLHLGDWRKSIRSVIHLLDHFSRCPRRPRPT